MSWFQSKPFQDKHNSKLSYNYKILDINKTDVIVFSNHKVSGTLDLYARSDTNNFHSFSDLATVDIWLNIVRLVLIFFFCKELLFWHEIKWNNEIWNERSKLVIIGSNCFYLSQKNKRLPTDSSFPNSVNEKNPEPSK